MARATIPKVREVVDECPALSCDMCGFVFSTMEPDRLGQFEQAHPRFPVGAGVIHRATQEAFDRYSPVNHSANERRDLCSTCMEAVWLYVEKRSAALREERARLDSALSASSSAASDPAPRE